MDFNKEAVEAVANANNNFGNVLFKILAKPEQNLIMSSFSVSTVLNMILNGAKGSTASQLKQGLSLKDFDVVKNGFKDALKLMKTNENFTLSAANRYVNYGVSNLPYLTKTTLINCMCQLVVKVICTVVCIKVRRPSFPRFWKNHP
jgi:serine protease inhibitor